MFLIYRNIERFKKSDGISKSYTYFLEENYYIAGEGIRYIIISVQSEKC